MNEKLQVKDERSFGYARVDNAILDDEAIDIYAQSVYMALCRFASNDDRRCFPSAETIAEKAKCSRRKVFDALGTLESRGYIRREQRIVDGQQKSSIYRIVGAPRALSVCTSCTPPVHDVHPPRAPRAHGTRPNELDLKNYNPPISPQGDDGEDLPSEGQDQNQAQEQNLIQPQSPDTTEAKDLPSQVALTWNRLMPHAPQVRLPLSPARKKAINARTREIPGAKDLSWWEGYFERIRAIPRFNGLSKGRYEGQTVKFNTVIRPSFVDQIMDAPAVAEAPESPYVQPAMAWLRKNYPKPETVDAEARTVLMELMPIGCDEARKAKISARLGRELAAYVRTDQVKEGFVRRASNWLKSIDWRDES